MAERYIPEHRRTQYKAKSTFKPDELRRRREEQQVEIRKQKREENLAKRRGIQTRDGGVGVGGPGSADSDEEGVTNESEVSVYKSFIFCLIAILSWLEFVQLAFCESLRLRLALCAAVDSIFAKAKLLPCLGYVHEHERS